MSIIHFLNVRNGDCSIIEHTSGRVSVIDICNGNEAETVDDKVATAITYSNVSAVISEAISKGNFRQKDKPEDPISYLRKMEVREIFRFILTHPDMDHLDGFKRLFDEFNVCNFWDTENNKKIESFKKSPYNSEDWLDYQKRRKRALHFYAGDHKVFFNTDENGGNGDYLQILGPTQELVEKANQSGNYNNASYVILYNEFGKKILFSGDSEKEEWDIILEEDKNKAMLSNIDVLIAPHHGRKSGGNDEFLDVLNPKLTLFGNAKSKDLNYSDWYELPHYTNNQGGNFVLDVKEEGIDVYCSNEAFARSENGDTIFKKQLDAWFLRTIAEAIQ